MDVWMQKDVELFRRLIARGDTSDEIADRLQCSKGDVWVKARELGMVWRLADVERRKVGYVRFIAEYEDGSKDTFIIDCWALETGDHVAPIVARERQEEGRPPRGDSLKPGKIVKVYRDPVVLTQSQIEDIQSGG